jgi:phage terminase small subunit
MAKVTKPAARPRKPAKKPGIAQKAGKTAPPKSTVAVPIAPAAVKLTPKQRLFIAEYLIDLNATQAAIRAGYSTNRADAMGHENLRKPEIAAEIELAMKARAEKTGISAERVLLEVSRLAFFDVRKMYKPDGSMKLVTELDDETAAALAGLDVTEEFEGAGDARKLAGYTKKAKVADKIGALTLCMRHLGMLNDKLVVENTVTVKDFTGKGSFQ